MKTLLGFKHLRIYLNGVLVILKAEETYLIPVFTVFSKIIAHFIM